MRPASGVDLEGVLPSVLLGKQGTLSKNLALGSFLSAAHYPEWSMGNIPPEDLDYSRFDILFFGMSYCRFFYFFHNLFAYRFCYP